MKNPLFAIIFLLMLAGFNHVFAQAPVITYTSPQTYSVGVAIAPLSPVNTGGAVPAVPIVTTFAGNGIPGAVDGPANVAEFNGAVGLAVDATGNVYVADVGNNLIRKITPAGVVTTFAGTNVSSNDVDGQGTAARFNGPRSIAVDGSGNIYVADSEAIRVISPGGYVATLNTNFGFTQLAADAAGDVYIATTGEVWEISHFGAVSLVAPAQSFCFSPSYAAVDASGNVYSSDSFNDLIFKITPAGIVTTFAGNCNNAAGSGSPCGNCQGGFQNGQGTSTFFQNPLGLAVDASGNVYVADFLNQAVRKITPAGLVTTYAGITGGPNSVAVDAANNVYVSDGLTIKKITPGGGYTISPALPAGLAFDNTTGVISGTPLVTSPATNYTVIAHNANGSDIVTVNISAISTAPNNASLANLTVSGGSLTPAFASGTSSYTASVGNAVSSITLTPTAVNGAASITVNNTPVASGSASASVPLSVGANTIITKVTSQDGTTTMTYSIVITRAPSVVSYLANLTLSSGPLTPAFAYPSGTNSYTASVGIAISSVTVTPTAVDNTATITVNGMHVTSGSASASIPLAIGANTVKTIVTAQDGITSTTYMVTVTRGAPPTLTSLTISTGVLTPLFAPSTNNYSVRVGRTVSSIRLTPTAREASFVVTINGIHVNSGSQSPGLPLVAGLNNIFVQVTNRNGVADVYTISVTRESGTTMVNANSLGLDNLENQTDSLQNGNVMVHQAISPNGDGINDVLTIDNIGNYPDNNVTLIDMSGTAIFKISGYDNVNKVFNGHSNITGALQQPGTYFYVLDYKVNGELKHHTGYFVLKY